MPKLVKPPIPVTVALFAQAAIVFALYYYEVKTKPIKRTIFYRLGLYTLLSNIGFFSGWKEL